MNMENLLQTLFFAVILVGIVGNMLNILVFSRRSMRKSLSFRILLYLSVIDLTILSLCAVETFSNIAFNFDMRVFSVFFCKFDTFLAYFLTQARNIVSMGITIERTKIVSKIKAKKRLRQKEEEDRNGNMLNNMSTSSVNVPHEIPMHKASYVELDTLNACQTTITTTMATHTQAEISTTQTEYVENVPKK